MFIVVQHDYIEIRNLYYYCILLLLFIISCDILWITLHCKFWAKTLQQCYKSTNNSIFRTVIIVALRVSKPNPSQQFSFWASKISPEGWRKRCPGLFPNARIAWRWNFHQTRPKNPFHIAPNSSTDTPRFWEFSDDFESTQSSILSLLRNFFFNCWSMQTTFSIPRRISIKGFILFSIIYFVLF